MKNRIIGVLAVGALLALSAAAQTLEPPKLDPTPSTESQKQLIKEGVALHDQGDYDAAISRYEQVLRENPANIEALYEMSFSYFQNNDCKKSLEIALKASVYKSDLLGAIYGEIGNCQDDLGKPKDAIETFKLGIKLLPNNYLLHYNLGLTFARLGQMEEARTSLKESATLNPDHASSQNVLSIVFDKGGYKIPSLLAASRFLVLEPTSKRSVPALQLVDKVMQAGVSPAKNGNNINIVVGTGQKKDEGDFESFDLFMGLMKAADYTEKNKGKSEIQHLVDDFNVLFAYLSESTSKSDRTKFTWQYYVPYFVEMKKQGHTEAFVYYINQQGNKAGVGEWLKQNQNKVAAFLNWSKGHDWSKG